METTISFEPSLAAYDSGGGCCSLALHISIDPHQHPDMQRRAVIHEVLEAMLGYLVPHENIDRIMEEIVDALERLAECHCQLPAG